jgi:hypothetical protein
MEEPWMSKLFQIKIGIIAGVVGLTFALSPMQAQTCTVAPTSLQALSLERVLTLSNVLSTQTATIPANILASITGGAQEIRERLIFNPLANTLTSTVFLVAAGSPNPTPIGVDLTQSTLEGFTLNIDRIYTSCKPVPNVLLVGTIGQSSGGINTPAGLFGSFIGAPAAISIGYTTDNPAKVNNAVVVIAGTVVDFSASASGTLTFPPSPVTPPGTSGAPSIVIVPALPATTGSRIQVVTNPLHLDASATTDPNGKTLTFQYSSVPPVAFSPSPNVPNPDVQFPSGGDFTITLTVTNSAGLVSTIQLPFQFVGRPGF